ncbi:RsmB/NOP family class I SAM-dependent RNA methyltransferase [Pedobacter sp. MC2016-14]|uniref:RsmB/NOP family class I SAM-dependent RNA methyltransferase n=1 Tax=Pedobacter sp. MC2016-14 TaxID=2897327 RepID=UPI001E5DDD74|nr:RsmB/NOP family class I SAM-dependent RNA methyltransferase [Pedobacter sp. MC2016-14]MCD0490361.1 RsmB/NOP family class I SAM-dependent RNA methyltransferase [Pedobacter sp. MC2016-14]
MKVEHQIRAFEQLLAQYDGTMPLHRFLVAYFKKNRQMGSSDRRWASRYVYSFFRLGRSLADLLRRDPVQRLAIADFLCNASPSLVIEQYLPELLEQVSLPVAAKLVLIQDLYPDFKLSEVFAFTNHLSEGITTEAFLNSYFTQPDLFIRVAEKHSHQMLELLQEAQVDAKELGPTTFSLPNGTKLEKILPEQKYYQVQDLSSQKTGALFQPKAYDYWWDCCAASGGKSLLLHQLEPKVQLLVSDLRENSLHNLDERFQVAGLKKYQKKALDLLQNNEQDLHDYEFDGIILDAPCSGSGTWGRTPEMLSQFEVHKIGYFSKLQKSIAANVIKYLKPGKPLIYITCSVFKEENEEVVGYIESLGLKVETMEIIGGYQDKADTMFAARLIKL